MNALAEKNPAVENAPESLAVLGATPEPPRRTPRRTASPPRPARRPVPSPSAPPPPCPARPSRPPAAVKISEKPSAVPAWNECSTPPKPSIQLPVLRASETLPLIPEENATRTTPRPSLDDPAFVSVLDRQSNVLESLFFPAQVIGALSLGENATVTAVRHFLIRFREEAGAPRDAVEKVLVDQLALAHLKVGELYAQAAAATNLEFKQLYSAGATKLLATICQLVTTLTAYRAATSRGRGRGAKAGLTAKRGGKGQVATEVDPDAGEENSNTQQGSKVKKGRR